METSLRENSKEEEEVSLREILTKQRANGSFPLDSLVGI
jgi:hypothetical protein